MNAEQEIRALLTPWLQACRDVNMEGITACYADDIVAYDAVAALQFVGLEAYRQHWQMCIDQCPGTMVFEWPDVQMIADTRTVICYGLLRCGVESPDDEKCSWMRATQIWQKRAERWLIVHEHFSAPFDEQGQALFNLQP